MEDFMLRSKEAPFASPLTTLIENICVEVTRKGIIHGAEVGLEITLNDLNCFLWRCKSYNIDER